MGKALQPQLVLPVGHTSGINYACFSKDGKLILTAADDGTAKLWEIAGGRLLHSIEGQKEGVYKAAFSPSGRFISALSDKLYSSDFSGESAGIWETLTGEFVEYMKEDRSVIKYIGFSPSEHYIIEVLNDKTSKVWDSSTGTLLFRLEGHKNDVYYGEFSPDEKIIVTASRDGSVKLWETETGKLLNSIPGRESWKYYPVFSPDSKYLLVASEDEILKIYETGTGTFLFDLVGSKGLLKHTKFSPDSKYIVAVSDNDADVKLWNAHTGKLYRIIKNDHIPPVYSFKFSPDGEYILTAGWGGTAKLIKLSSGKIIHVLEGHFKTVLDASFSPDEKYFSLATHYQKRWTDISVSFSPYGKENWSYNDQKILKLWN